MWALEKILFLEKLGLKNSLKKFGKSIKKMAPVKKKKIPFKPKTKFI